MINYWPKSITVLLSVQAFRKTKKQKNTLTTQLARTIPTIMIRRKFGDDKTKRQNKNYVALGASSTFFTFLLIVASPMLRLSFYVALSRIRSTDAPSIFLFSFISGEDMIVLGVSWKRCKILAPSFLGAVSKPTSGRPFIQFTRPIIWYTVAYAATGNI